MKKFLMMVAFVAAAFTANAQNEVGQITLTPKVGVNMSNLSGDVDETKMKFGIVAGAEAEYGLMDKLGVSAGLLYSMQGCDFDVDGAEKMKMDYLRIPILANYYVTNGLAIKAGIQPSILLSAEVGDVDFKDECKTLEFAIPIGASYQISDFVIDARYNLGITKANDGDGSMKNNVIQITVGYKFAL